MNMKKLIAVILTVSIIFTIFTFSVFSITTVETQYKYDEADPSWLKDLIVMEQLDIDDATKGQLNKINAVSDNPFSHTEQSFKQELQYYVNLYSLNENSYMAAYIYVLQYLDVFSQATDTSVSDEYVRYYLEENGIVYPEKLKAEDLIVARTLYALLSSSNSNYKVEKGTSLETALMAYAAQMFGVDLSLIQDFSKSSIKNIQDYIIAACKYTLYLEGYNVSKDTSDEETARLMAIYVIRSQGVSVDENSVTFEELRSKYLAVMLGTTYSVTADPQKLNTSLKNNTVPSYILQLIGKEYNITVKESMSYSEMFDFIKTNTNYFNLEENEFYADVNKYDVKLEYIRDRVWVMPSSIYSSDIASDVKIYIDNVLVKDNYFNKVALDTSKKSQSITITVLYTNGTTNTKKTTTYYVNIFQGTEKAPEGTNYISAILQQSQDRIKEILSDIGTDTTIADIFSNVSFALPTRVLSIMSLLVPSFITDSNGYEYIKKLFGFADSSETPSQPVNTDNIGGVGGLQSYLAGLDNPSVSVPFSTQLIQINANNNSNISFSGVSTYTPTEIPTNPADYNFTDQGQVQTNDNAFLGIAVVVLAIAIGVTGIALTFMLDKNGKGKGKGKAKHKKNKKRNFRR